MASKETFVTSYSMTPMETSESLSMESKREYLAKMRWRYAHARGRRYKSRLIEELIALCGYSRKHAIKRLNRRGRAAGVKEKRTQSDLSARSACGAQAHLVWERSTLRQTTQSGAAALVAALREGIRYAL